MLEGAPSAWECGSIPSKRIFKEGPISGLANHLSFLSVMWYNSFMNQTLDFPRFLTR